MAVNINTISENITKIFNESLFEKNKVLPTLISPVAKAIELFINCFSSDGKILICGNGGSASDSQHFSAELINRFEIERNPYPAIALSTDTSVITSIGNDYDFNLIFAKQVIALAKAEDILVAISTSGNSQNVINAVGEMHKKNGKVIALTGNDGGKLAKIIKPDDVLINIATTKTARIQEMHIMVIHAICDGIDKSMEKKV